MQKGNRYKEIKTKNLMEDNMSKARISIEKDKINSNNQTEELMGKTIKQQEKSNNKIEAILKRLENDIEMKIKEIQKEEKAKIEIKLMLENLEDEMKLKFEEILKQSKQGR